MTTEAQARKVMGRRVIGLPELHAVAERLKITVPSRIPPIPFTLSTLERAARDHVLVLGVRSDALGRPLTINSFREHFGIDPAVSEPCMYNQDWYVREAFAARTRLKARWYLIGTAVAPDTSGQLPDSIERRFARRGWQYPSAILATFTFFANYFLHNGELLWRRQFIWCSDRDHHGDRIYVGHYLAQRAGNRNGFNIHRHLSLRPVHGAVGAM